LHTFIEIFRKLIVKLGELNAHTSVKGSGELMSQKNGVIAGKTIPSAQQLPVTVNVQLHIPPSNWRIRVLIAT